MSEIIFSIIKSRHFRHKHIKNDFQRPAVSVVPAPVVLIYHRPDRKFRKKKKTTDPRVLRFEITGRKIIFHRRNTNKKKKHPHAHRSSKNNKLAKLYGI